MRPEYSPARLRKTRAGWICKSYVFYEEIYSRKQFASGCFLRAAWGVALDLCLRSPDINVALKHLVKYGIT